MTEEIELLDGEIHTVKIEYEKENLKVYLDANTEPLLDISVSIADCLTLEHGSCHVGIC